MAMGIGIIVSLCLVIMAGIYQARAIKIKALQDKRMDEFNNREFDIEKYFLEKGYNQDLIKAYTDAIHIAIKKQDFVIMPEDNFYKDYDLFETNVRDIMTDVSIELKFGNPKSDEIETYEKEHGKLETVDAVMRFLNSRMNK